MMGTPVLNCPIKAVITLAWNESVIDMVNTQAVETSGNKLKVEKHILYMLEIANDGDNCPKLP